MEDKDVEETYRERAIAANEREERMRQEDIAYRHQRDDSLCARCDLAITDEDREGSAVVVAHKHCVQDAKEAK